MRGFTSREFRELKEHDPNVGPDRIYVGSDFGVETYELAARGCLLNRLITEDDIDMGARKSEATELGLIALRVWPCVKRFWRIVW